MPAWLQAWLDKPFVAHLARAGQRYTGRLGPQFAAATTYFSVLALVPLLMVALSIVGFVLFVVRPDQIAAVAEQIGGLLTGVDATTRAAVQDFALDRLRNWAAIGVIGLALALYSGAGWMTNLRNAMDTQLDQDSDLRPKPQNIVLQTLSSVAYLLGLIIAIAVTFGFAAISTALSDQVIDWLGLTNTPGLSLAFALIPIVLSLGAGWLTFCYLYTVLPTERPPWHVVIRGALIGSVGLAVLQYLTSFLISIFSSNKAVQLFGPVILLMLFFNLFAQLILFIAAWIATAHHDAFPEQDHDVRFALTPEPDEAPESGPEPEPVLEPVVSEKAAVRSVRVGMGAGYVTGAATGVGIGAVIAFIAAVLGRRR